MNPIRVCVLVALLVPASALSAGAGLAARAYTHSPSAAKRSRLSTARMVLELPRLPLPWAARPEIIYEGRSRIEYLIETIHLTKRRVSGSISIDAPACVVWDLCTAYEQQPDMIPSILSHTVSREGDGRVFIDQLSLLSSKMKLRTEMRLEAIEDVARQQLVLRRVSGHGFMEFEARYALSPGPGGKTTLRYTVELVPCPLFPLPLVERKIRKEVPKCSPL
jgi:carbon monoxide dehydrogenase subunit G